MSELRLSMTVSLDGYAAGAEQTRENPLGIGGENLHGWMVSTRAFQQTHGGGEGGEEGPNNAVVEAMFENLGASIMGRNMFGGGPGPWGDEEWTGYWGDDPPFHHPVFVLTHHAREPVEMEGGTTFHFVTDGIESALEQARDAADGKDVSLGGGPSTAQEYIRAGLLDEARVSLVPLFLGGGVRLFDNVSDAPRRPRQAAALEAPGVTHLTYRFD